MIKTEHPSGKNQTVTYLFSGVRDKVEYRNTLAGPVTGTDTFTYDDLLRPTGSTSADGITTAMTYTDRGQTDTNSTTFGGQTYTLDYDYDDRGRMKEILYPSGRKAEYTFDDRSQLDTIKWDNSQIEDRGYNDNGLLTSVDRPQVDETRGYDNRNLVTSIDNPSVLDADYTYDANGNKLTETFDGVMASKSFTTQAGADDGYDDEDRFMRFNQTGNNATFTRSDIGNISNVNLNGTGAARNYSNIHELTSVGGQTQIFDADGNLVTRNGGATLTWDDAGRLESVTDTGTTSYGYDATGKRVTKSDGSITTVYVYAGPNCIGEYVSGTAAASPGVEFVYAPGIDSLVLVDDGTNELAVLRNQQWSVTALVNNSSGSVAERYAYDHFGKRTIYAANGTTVRTASSHKNPYGYTSRRHDDESGLMYYRARYYDPATGEFISQDPLEYVDGMSQYRAYFVPTGMDPSGRVACPPPKNMCGPDSTRAFVTAIARASVTLRNLPPLANRGLTNDPISWGSSIDFDFKGIGAKKFAGCATGRCKESVFFCGKCIRSSVLNNILYGIVGAANGLPVNILNVGGHLHNLSTSRWPEGLEQQSAYWVGWQIWTIVVAEGNAHINTEAICAQVKRHKQINNFKGFEKCKPCGKQAGIGDFKFGIGDPLPTFR